MTPPDLRLLDGDTFFIDNSRYELLMKCMRAAEYGIVYQRTAAETKAALKFGEAIHLAQKFRYKFFGNNEITTEGQIRQFILLEKYFEDWQPGIGEHRTLGFGQDVIEAYNKNYPFESFEILKTPTGVNVVEEGFAIPLGEVVVDGKTYKIVWKGRLDLGIQEHDEVWALDHKTTAMGGDWALGEYPTSNQMKGYTWALQQILGKNVKGAIVNLLICRKQTKTGKGIEFTRGKFAYDDETLAEWQQNTLHLVGDFINSYNRGYFTMETTQCLTKYGPCQFRGTCTMSPATRLQDLATEIYKSDAFDPLHEDVVDLDAIAAMPIPANYKRIEPADVAKQSAEEMSSVMKGLLSL